MLQPILFVHSNLRWLVLAGFLGIILFSLQGWLQKKDWSNTNSKLILFSVIALDIQLILGLLLYSVLSPITTGAFSSFGAGMKDPQIRFYLVEHPTLMVLALALSHIGKVKTSKKEDPVSKFKTSFLFFTISLLLLLVGTPWNK